jgi:hypothetical protein
MAFTRSPFIVADGWRNHEAILDVSGYADEVAVPAF